MGAHRRAIEQTNSGQLSEKDREREDWVNKQRGVKSTRMAGQAFPGKSGGLFGIMNIMTAGLKPYRDADTRAWIDKQRGVESDPREGKGGNFFDVMRLNERKKGERDSWIDEQIRRGKENREIEEVRERTKNFTPLTQEERRSKLNEENFRLTDIWDK
tara:strand:+ start:6647 stop:7120 length:474 start_codon:yes stop_codon:yes gene_type:complete